MSAGVLAVVLLGAFLHASWNALVHGSREKLLDTVLILCGAALISLCLLPALGLPDPASLPWLFASLAIHMAYFTLVIHSYRGGELSIVYPLMRGSAPALSALGTPSMPSRVSPKVSRSMGANTISLAARSTSATP